MNGGNNRVVDPFVCGASQGGQILVPTASARKRPSWKPEQTLQDNHATSSSSSTFRSGTRSRAETETITQVVHDLVYSERSYVARLGKLLSHYVQPLLLDSASQKPKLMSRQIISPLIIFFDSIELMREIHVNLLKDIENRMKDVDSEGAAFVADLFEQ